MLGIHLRSASNPKRQANEKKHDKKTARRVERKLNKKKEKHDYKLAKKGQKQDARTERAYNRQGTRITNAQGRQDTRKTAYENGIDPNASWAQAAGKAASSVANAAKFGFGANRGVNLNAAANQALYGDDGSGVDGAGNSNDGSDGDTKVTTGTIFKWILVGLGFYMLYKLFR